MKILGIDTDSRKIAAVCFENGELKNWILIESKEKNTNDRIFELITKFEDVIIKGFNPDFVLIEESIYISNFKTSRALSEVIGNCKYLLQKNNIKYDTVSNKTWKKHIIGNGNATKDEIREKIEEFFPKVKGEKQDLLDAAAIAYFAQKYYFDEGLFEKHSIKN